MSTYKKHLLLILLFTFLPISNLVFAQKTSESFEELWKKIEKYESSEIEKLNKLNQYISKAQKENNTLEQYRALAYKTFLVSYDEAIGLFDEITPIVNELQNDSIKGAFVNRKTLFYYKSREFQKALYYAIEGESISEKSKNLYNLYSVRIDIGNIYYHTMNYDKALHYFNLCKEYYKNQPTVNDKRAYVVSLYSLGKTYWRLGNTEQLDEIIKESEIAIHKLPSRFQEFETAYLNYLKAGNHFLKKDYDNSKIYFENSLSILRSNEDFTNEHIVYLYLGKIAWEQNQKAEAITYFQRIDELFRTKNFLNYELREAYEYLITYYKETGQPQKQLEATENLLLLNKQFEKEQLSVTHTLHSELDTKKWESSKEELQNQLAKNKIWYFIFVVGFILLGIYSYWLRNERKKLRLKFEKLLHNIEEEKITTSLRQPGNASINEDHSLEKETIDRNSTELKLLKLLQRFEDKKGYLSPLKLEDLAIHLGTNRTTLSTVLNDHKGGFLTYINSLRIHKLLTDLTIDSELRKKTISELSEMYGFVNEKTFTTHFKKQTGLTPSYFIKQLDLKDLGME